MNHKFKRQLIIISVLEFKAQNLNQELKKSNQAVYEQDPRSNDITYNTVDQIDVKDIVNRIINIGKKCLSYSVKEVTISFIFIKKWFKLTRIIRQINDFLRDECKINNFELISKMVRTYILFAGNLADFLNDSIFSKSILLTEEEYHCR